MYSERAAVISFVSTGIERQDARHAEKLTREDGVCVSTVGKKGGVENVRNHMVMFSIMTNGVQIEAYQ